MKNKMGKYFNPVSVLCSIGRPIGAFSYESLKSQLKDGEYLIGYFVTLQNIMVCPHLDCAETYLTFERNSFEAQYFAISKAAFDEYVK